MCSVDHIFEYKQYPLLPIRFTYQDKDTPYIDGLLDSGGDFIVIPYAIARYLGVPLIKAGSVDTAGGKTTLYKATVQMTINNPAGPITYDTMEIHVSTRNDIPVLLGRTPIFEDHEIIFRKKHDQLILKTINQG